MLYGLVATSIIDPQCLMDDELFRFCSPHTKHRELDIAFLFAVIKLDRHGKCEFIFPPRYAQHSKMHQDDLTMCEVVRQFGSELPTIFSRIEMFNDFKLDHVHFFRHVSYLGLQGRPFKEKGMEYRCTYIAILTLFLIVHVVIRKASKGILQILSCR